MDQAERKDTAQHALVYVGVAVAVAVVLVLLWYAIDVVLLAFVGVLFAILLRAPADWLSGRFGWSEGRSLALVAGALVLLLAVGAVFFGRGIAVQALALIDRIPEIVQGFKDQLSQSELGARVVALAESSGMFSGGDGDVLGRGLGLIGSTFGAIANVLIVVFFAVFIAAQPRLYVEGALYLFPRRKRSRMREVLHEIGRVLRRWLVGQTLLAACVAFLTGAGLLLIGAPFPFALGLLAGLMEFVPYIGPFLAAVPAIMVGFAEAPDVALYVAVLFVFIQLIESYVLAPLVQHRAVHLPPAAILFAQVLMGAIVGALGVAVATPLAAAVMVALGMLYVEDALGDPKGGKASRSSSS
ncbi:MAG TPA: AI-2E family transporter [Burkholderiales bacterium]